MRKQGSFFQSWSIAQSLILTFSVIILFVTAFMTYWTFYSVDRELEISTTEYTDHLLHRVNAKLEQYVEYMKDVSDYVSNNPTILEFLQLRTGEYRRDQRENIAQQLLSLAHAPPDAPGDPGDEDGGDHGRVLGGRHGGRGAGHGGLPGGPDRHRDPGGKGNRRADCHYGPGD